jgi:hypothetical protein
MTAWQLWIIGMAINAFKAALPGLKARAANTKTPWDDRVIEAIDEIVAIYDTGALRKSLGK